MSISASAAPLKPDSGPAPSSSLRRRRRGLAFPLALSVLLSVLILVPIVLMFIGAIRTGTFVDPKATFSLRSLTLVYTTLPYLKTQIGRAHV